MSSRNRRGPSTIPVPAVTFGRAPGRTAPKTGSISKPTPATSVPKARVIDVRVLGAFYQNLPHLSLQQLSFVQEEVYAPLVLRANGYISIFRETVPKDSVWVLTDIEYYATAPASQLGAAPVRLDRYALSGMISFDLLISGVTPLFINNLVYPGYPGAGLAQQRMPGWNALEYPIGAQRTSGFAVYARTNEQVEILIRLVHPTQLPQFPITKVGTRIAGWSVQEEEFDNYWKAKPEAHGR